MDIQLTNQNKRLYFYNDANEPDSYYPSKLLASYNYDYVISETNERYNVLLVFCCPFGVTYQNCRIQFFIKSKEKVFANFWDTNEPTGSIYNQKQQIHNKVDKYIFSWNHSWKYIRYPKPAIRSYHKIIDTVFEEPVLKSYSFPNLRKRYIAMYGI